MSQPAERPALAMKRGRPTADKAAHLERAILASARRLFLAEGFDAATMERIAADTGITRTTLYSRYPAKVDLFRAVVQAALAGWYEASPIKRMPPVTDIRDMLNIRVAEIAAFLVDPLFWTLHSLIQSNQHRFPDLSSMVHEVGYQNGVRLLAGDISAAAERDGIPARAPEEIAEQLIAAIYGWFLQYATVRDLTAEDIEMYGRRVVKLLLAARDQW